MALTVSANNASNGVMKPRARRGPGVERLGDGIEPSLVVDRQVPPLGQVLAKSPLVSHYAGIVAGISLRVTEKQAVCLALV